MASPTSSTVSGNDTIQAEDHNQLRVDILAGVGNDTKNVGYNRAAAAASGNVSHTGAGFTPTHAIIIAYGVDGSDSWSVGQIAEDGTLVCIASLNSGATLSLPTSAVRGADSTGANIQEATDFVSWDSDGVTLTWTKTGSGEQINFQIFYFR